MKKILACAVVMLFLLAPLSFALAPCQDVGSEDYLTATSAKLVRGVGNVAFCWVELFRQPTVNENKWEGVGRGIVLTPIRALAGAVEAATSIIPNASIPQPDPACPTDLVKS